MNSQKSVQLCTEICAQLRWFMDFDDHSEWLNVKQSLILRWVYCCKDPAAAKSF